MPQETVNKRRENYRTIFDAKEMPFVAINLNEILSGQ
jgi:hypothetical protein